MGNNSFLKLFLKLFFRLFVLNICCFVMCAFCFSVNGSPLVRVLLQIICIVSTITFVYPVCYNSGDLDAPLVSIGHKKKSPLKGLYLGLITTSPMIISSIVLLLSKYINLFDNFMTIYKMINAVYFPLLYSILPVDYSIAELPLITILFAISIQIVIPIICMFAYLLGFNRFSFKEKLFYNKKAS